MTTTLMIRNSYPNDKAQEAGKIFLKAIAKKLPPFMKRLEVYIEPRETGMNGYAIYEIDDDKVGDGVRELTNRQVLFHEIPGYRWRIAILMKAAEALPMVGLAPPAK